MSIRCKIFDIYGEMQLRLVFFLLFIICLIDSFSDLKAATDLDVDIAIRINPSRKLVEFSIRNYEGIDIECSKISIATNYVDQNGYFIVRRHITIRDQVVRANDFHVVPERGQEIIDSLEGQYDNPRIRDFHGSTIANCVKRPGFLEMCEDESITSEQRNTIDLLKKKVSEKSCFNTYQELKNIDHLDLANSDISDLSPMKDLFHLRSLKLQDTSVSNLTPLSQFSNLRRLYLNKTLINNLRPIANLKNLIWLSLNETKVSSLVPLVGLSELQFLNLTGTYVKREHIDWIKQNLPNVNIFSGLAPIVHLPYTDGSIKDISKSSVRTKHKILIFLTYSCLWCRTIVPSIKDLVKNLEDKAEVHLVMPDSKKKCEAFLSEVNVDIPTAMDLEFLAMDSYLVSYVPHLVVISRDHEILFNQSIDSDHIDPDNLKLIIFLVSR